jgi:hypothetical protein
MTEAYRAETVTAWTVSKDIPYGVSGKRLGGSPADVV